MAYLYENRHNYTLAENEYMNIWIYLLWRLATRCFNHVKFYELNQAF